jgi:hypothetical protein
MNADQKAFFASICVHLRSSAATLLIRVNPWNPWPNVLDAIIDSHGSTRITRIRKEWAQMNADQKAFFASICVHLRSSAATLLIRVNPWNPWPNVLDGAALRWCNR